MASMITSHARVLTGAEVKAHHRAIAAEKKRKKIEESNEEIQEKKKIQEEKEREQRKNEKKEKRIQRRLEAETQDNDKDSSSKNDSYKKLSKKSSTETDTTNEPTRKKHKSKSDVEKNTTPKESEDAAELEVSTNTNDMDIEDISSSLSSKPKINAAVEALSILAVNDDEADQIAMELERKQQKNEKKSTILNNIPNASNKPLWMIRGQSIDSDTRIPITNYSLHPDTIGILRSHGIESFFATQSTVIPMVLNSHGIHDICVAAPTGSGKTLSYVIPIIERLRLMIIRRLRVLVVVPTRDLALQVKSVFDWFCPSFGLKCEIAIGQNSFALEQSKIIKYSASSPSSINYSNSSPFFHSSDNNNDNILSESLIDILICTPGRLMDHLHSTPGFSLQWVQWLIIDEVDRLLTQHYHDWIVKILQAIYKNNPMAAGQDKDDDSNNNNDDSLSISKNNSSVNNNGPHGWMQIIDSSNRYRYANRDHLQEPLQKLLFSATLTTNPAKLSSLDLRHPLFFSETSSYKKHYKIPPSLRQRVIRCETGNKPLVLIYLLQMILFNLTKNNNNNTMDTDKEAVAKLDQEPFGAAHQVIIFTSSLQSTHRLYRLLELYCINNNISHSSSSSPRFLSEYSSSLTQSVRSSLLSSFRLGQLRILICSDIMARGIDLPSVDAVINYDIPVYIKTYIHRVGRTARAGKHGWAYNLCRKEDYHHFYSILKYAENSYLLPITINNNQLELLVPRFIQCLESLKKILNEELSGKLLSNAPLPINRIPTIQGNNDNNNSNKKNSSKEEKNNKKKEKDSNNNNTENKKVLIEAEAMIEEGGEEEKNTNNNQEKIKSKSIKKEKSVKENNNSNKSKKKKQESSSDDSSSSSSSDSDD